jgi:predicted O-linked N-acetylglucosamine transferase (SPINDLY family)
LPEKRLRVLLLQQQLQFAPEVFAVWMRLLRAVPGSVLWLPQGNPAAMRNLTTEAEARGVAPDRLKFAPYIAEGDLHLARMACADLFLDTLPYNAHTTAADALWAGLPLLTCKGATFAGRVAASLLSACGLPETDHRHRFPLTKRRALSLVRDASALAAIRRKLQDNRATSPLFRHAALHAPPGSSFCHDVGARSSEASLPRASW